MRIFLHTKRSPRRGQIIHNRCVTFCDKRKQLSLLKLLSVAKILSEAKNDIFNKCNFKSVIHLLRYAVGIARHMQKNINYVFMSFCLLKIKSKNINLYIVPCRRGQERSPEEVINSSFPTPVLHQLS